MRPLLLGFLLLACVAAPIYASTLYSIVTELSWSSQQTSVYTVKIDMRTGAVTNVTTNFVYFGTYTLGFGNSAFDQKNGRYYFAMDADTAFIYGTDVKNEKPLPTLDIGADYIIDLEYDTEHQRLYTLYTASSNSYLAAIGPQTFDTVLNVTTTFNANYPRLMKGAVDGRTNTFYLAGKIGNLPEPTYGLVTVNLANSQVVKRVSVDNACIAFIEYMWLDRATGLIFAGGLTSNGQMGYWFLKINPTSGACTMTPLSAKNGIIISWSYDPTTNQLWFVEVVTTGSVLLNSYNVRTGVQNPPVTVVGTMPESIELSTQF